MRLARIALFASSSPRAMAFNDMDQRMQTAWLRAEAQANLTCHGALGLADGVNIKLGDIVTMPLETALEIARG